MGRDLWNDRYLGDKQAWLLLLLGHERRGRPLPIVGTTRLAKLLFLLDRKLEELYAETTSFDFVRHKYGPFSPDIYDAVEELRRKGLIEVQKGAHQTPDIYHLTPRGEAEARRVRVQAPPHAVALADAIHERFGTMRLAALLSFVYRQYPDMTERSEIRDRVLGDQHHA